MMSIKLRMILVLSAIIVIPEGTALYILESGRIEKLQTFLSVHLALSLVLLIPLSRLCSYLIIGREISELFVFCRNIQAGRYHLSFSLPNEQEDEPELIKLKRLLNWMANSLSIRETNSRRQLGRNEELKRHYQHLSMHDELTRLYNRRFFNSHLKTMVREALHNRDNLSLMLIDIDNFKKVNDTLGHQEGDTLLKTLAEILFNSIRSESDIPFRFGGDEFGIIFPDISGQEQLAVATRIKESYARSAPDITSLSIGVASLRKTCRDPESGMAELVRAADDCVYKAKRNGRNTVVVDSYEVCLAGIHRPDCSQDLSQPHCEKMAPLINRDQEKISC